MLIDGLPATEEDLRYLAVVNYGAYTSFRVEAGGARGLDLHLGRLDANAIELFGETVDRDWLIDLMRMGLDDRREGWMRISLFSAEIAARTPSPRVSPRTMIVVSEPPPPLAESVRVQVRTYARDDAHVKHTATFPLIRARRLARDAGFDDALFADAEGLISEGSLWNVGFLRGDEVIWPRAPMLRGVAQALIARRLDQVGLTQRTAEVHVDDLSGFDSAFLCNSATPACPITAIGDLAFPVDAERIERLRAAWAANPIQSI